MIANIWGTICIVCFVLKVFGVVDISWWIILSPFWVGAIIFVLGSLFHRR